MGWMTQWGGTAWVGADARGDTVKRRYHAKSGRIQMAGYETPAITELGSVADFTQAGELAFDYDGQAFRGPVTS